MKRIAIVLVLLILLSTTVFAGPPGPPSGFRRAGTVKQGQVAVLRRGMTRVKVTTKPLLGPRVRVTARVYWRVWQRGLPLVFYRGHVTRTFWYDGQGGGGYLKDYLYIRFTARSGGAGTVALYVQRGWYRKR